MDLAFLQFHNPDRFRQIQACGKKTIFLQDSDTGEKIAKAARCKDVLCPSCGQIVKANLSQQINYYADKYNMRHFFTVTIRNQNIDELNQVFERIRRKMAMLDREQYIKEYQSKKGYTYEQAYDSYHRSIWRMAEYELWKKHFIRFRKMISKQILREINSSFDGKYDYELVEKYKGFEYTDIEDKEGFYLDFKKEIDGAIDRILAVYKKNSPAAYQADCEVQLAKICLNSGQEFAYVRILEYQKNGNPHFHILSNFYFNYYIVDSVLNQCQDSKIYKSEDLGALDTSASGSEKSEIITRYVTKYITKETDLNLLETGEQNRDVITSSNNIHLTMDGSLIERRERMKKYRLLKVVDFLPRRNWEKVDGDLDVYISRLVQASDRFYHPNQFLADVQKEYENMKLSLKEYVNQHRYDEDFESNVKQYEKELRERYAERKSFYETSALLYELERRKHVVPSPLTRSRGFGSLNLDASQKAFLKSFSTSRALFTFLLGGAGTGKTTMISQFLQMYNLKGMRVGIVSYTGKAVSRISESLRQHGAVVDDIDVATIHRLANSRFSEQTLFLNNEENVAQYNLIIIDEISLVSKEVLSHFLNAVPTYCRFICVGDNNQLNPVGSNSIIYEFELASHLFPKMFNFVRLEKNHRSGEDINDMAYSVLNGDVSSIDFIEYDIEKIEEDFSNDYQILSNSRRMTRKINRYLSSSKTQIKDTAFYNYNVKDKVIITRNDKANQVFNGDIMKIEFYDEQGVYLHDGHGKRVFYSYLDSVNFFAPASCLTIHKSQGSEYDCVSVVLDNKDKLLNRNLFYTALTRAKKKVKVYVAKDVDISLLTVRQQNDDYYTITDPSVMYHVHSVLSVSA